VRTLVTGANGFLGRSLVAELRRRGHFVRALVRPATCTVGLWDDGVEVARADLRGSPYLTAILEGIDVVLHLAADVRGDEAGALTTTVAGTQRLLTDMAKVGVRRLVLASSITVYDWHRVEGSLIEDSPLAQDLEVRGAYTLAKMWQERLAQRAQGIERVIMRPGFIWGRGNEWVDGLGQRIGHHALIPGPMRQLPLTYVKNCAAWFADAAEIREAAGQTLNVFDAERITAWRYAREWATRSGSHVRLVPVPWVGAVSLVSLSSITNRLLFSGRGKFPSVLDKPRFEARFKPLRFVNNRLLRALGPQRLTWSEGLKQTFG
jgi:nucleoside-diphosphate-sugar epimerase